MSLSETTMNAGLSIRETILRIVSSLIPLDQQEEEDLAFVQRWIASGAQIFRLIKPDVPNIHLVSYFVVVDPSSGEFLLVDHKKAELWLPPGGHVEQDEHPKDTVKREAKEELGIEADFLFEEPLFLTVTTTVGKPPHHTDVSLWYVLRGNASDHLEFDREEFHQIRWFHWDDIPYEHADLHMKRFIDKALNKLRTLNSYETSATQYTTKTKFLHPRDQAQKFVHMLPSYAKIIDIGCGPGREAKIFSELGFEVVGVDFSYKMIDIAKQAAPNASFHVMDIESLAFPEASFDGAWANCALLHIAKKNIPAVLGKIYKALKEEGILYLSVKQGSDEVLEQDARYNGLEKFWSYFQKEELTDLLIHAGFEIEELRIAEKSTAYETHPLIKVFAKRRRA